MIQETYQIQSYREKENVSVHELSPIVLDQLVVMCEVRLSPSCTRSTSSITTAQIIHVSCWCDGVESLQGEV